MANKVSTLNVFKCNSCNLITEICDVDDVNTKITCVCGGTMSIKKIIYNPDKFKTRISGDYSHISDSLAIHPDQIAEHRALFPHIDVLPDGRPHFTSVKQHSDYLDKTGFYKHPQKIRSRI